MAVDEVCLAAKLQDSSKQYIDCEPDQHRKQAKHHGLIGKKSEETIKQVAKPGSHSISSGLLNLSIYTFLTNETII